jgi:hypothetical protein
MQFFRLQKAILTLGLMACAGFVAVTEAPSAYAQSAVTGAVSGVVSDATGAVVPNASVTVVNTGTDAKLTVTSNAEGRYTVGLLPPGTYKITATASGLQSETVQVSVLVGTTVPGDIKVTPTGDKTVVEVTSTSLPLVDTQNVALATTFNEEQIQELPTPGGDVTTIAFTAPGVVVNAGGSYGNFSSDGLPGISNLFVLNGFDNQDPFLNLNNSGSSNLTLGQGELAEATIVQNGYNSQYGRAAGAIINYTTKSGTNKFHGMADYNYNGTVLNANGWFNNLYGGPRPHAVSNEWAVNTGGPIIKDKVFFFADYEGLRYVLPGAAGLVNFPSPQFQQATLANVPASAQGLYGLAFAAYQGAPSYKNAQPIDLGTDAGGCGATVANGGMTGAAAPGGGTFGVDTPCMTQTFAETNNINKEWLFTGRGDWNISDKHKIYGRYKMDRGSQPTGTSFINPLFSTISIQPEYEGQFNDSYVISPTKTNVFVAAANWYTAFFGPQNIAGADAAMPWYFLTDLGFDGSGTSTSPGLASLGVPYYFPQGRNVTQYQFEDDFSWIHGKHSIKFGANMRRDLVSDYDAQVLTDYPLEETFTLGTFYSGAIAPGAGVYVQNFASQKTAHLALYNLGVYAQDEWQAMSNLKLTIGARIDRTGNPLCHQSCFSAYQGNFPASGASLTTPYSSAAGGAINPANPHPFPTVERVNFQPRFGANYEIGQKTEIRAGVGLFSDLYPAGFLDGAIQNFPNVNSVTVLSGNLGNAGAGTVTGNAIAANSALQSGFSSGQNITQINNTLSAQGIPFTPPAVNAYFPGTFRVPEYLEYSLQIQRQISRSDAVIVTYAGNYGYNEVLQNPYQNAATGYYNLNGDNAWDTFGTLGNVATTPADPSFSRVTAYTNDAHSNYNGGMVSFKHDGQGLKAQISYTYSHSLDMVSNGGEGEPFNGGSVLNQVTPSLGFGNLNYSNSDYDIRNNLVGDLVYEEPFFKSGNVIAHNALGGWVLGAKTYYRSGEPFSVTNSTLANFGYSNLGTTFMPQTVSSAKLVNTTPSNPKAAVAASGLGDCTQFVGFDSLSGSTPCGADANVIQTSFGNVRRNALYGPHYVNTDLSLLKKVINKERLTFQIGANAYNVWNHANFANPNAVLGSSSYGLITNVVSPPTSPYGSFQGAAVTQRVLQVHGKITF